MPTDFLHVAEAGVAQLRNRSGHVSRSEEWGDRCVIETKNWVRAFCRERGKIVPGTLREGKNVWTNTGREYVTLLMSLQPDSTPFRSDRISYLGVGTGAQTEDVQISSLQHPVSYVGSTFLAPLDVVSTSFPYLPTRTVVRYVRVFVETEITIPNVATSVFISELGLFTNGNQSSFAVGGAGVGRDTTITNASFQSPVAYKNLGEPIEKTDGLELEVQWEVRL